MTDATFTLSGIGAATTVVSTNGFDAAALIKNTGGSPLYAAAVPITDASQGFPIDAGGGTLTWAQGRPLYLIAPAGATSAVIDPGNGDGATTSPTDLANAILAGGLAQQIATAVNVTGVPPIDAPVELISFSGSSDGLKTFIGNEAPIDVSKYQSLRVYINIDDGPATDTTQCFSFGFADTAGATFQRTVYVEGHGGTSITGDFPCLGDYLFPLFDQPTETEYTIASYALYGSFRTSEKPRWQVANHVWQNEYLDAGPVKDCASSYAINIPVPASTALMLYPSWQTGDLYFSWWTTGPNSGGSFVGLLADGKSGHYLAGGELTTGVPASMQDYGPVVLFNRQPVLEINSHNTVTTNYDVALAFLD